MAKVAASRIRRRCSAVGWSPRQARSQALERYAGFCDARRYAYRGIQRAHRIVARATPHPLMTTVLEASGNPRFVHWALTRYRDNCPPPVTPARAR